jgi:succinate dehydrogenase / fumarate reductase flavoprotein subunit
MSEIQTIEHDVLVIGAGGAGLRAAIEASANGVRVGLVCKSLLGKAHTVMAEGGMAAAMGNVDDRDNWRVHFADTMRGGQYINNCRMAELHAKEAPERVKELEGWGALFDRTPDGRILQRNFGGHRYPRLAHVGDRTGLELIRTLQDHGVHQGVDVHMECTVVTLLKDGERVVGAFAYDRERGRFKVFKSKAVVLATGGVGRAFKITSNSWEYTGDGHSLAYHAGAALQDMEFVQFHPTGMIWPPSVRGILVTEGVRGEGGVLKNRDGKRFMFDNIPDNYKSQTADTPEEGWKYTQGDKNSRRPPELLTRDHVARMIVREVREGRGSPHGGVFLDIAWIKEKLPNAEEHIKRKLPSMYHQFMQLAGVDITKEVMEIGPTCHYIMGGIRVDGETQMSTVPGLFAAGECGAGLHGANRLGGNSLSDLIVFGKRAGEYAAKFAKSNGAVSIDANEVADAERVALAPFERGGGGEGPYQVQEALQEIMQDNVNIVRAQDQMEFALKMLGDLKRRADAVRVPGNREYNPGWHTALDLNNLLTVSEAITRCAIERKESRGGHFRDDYPDKDPAYGTFNLLVRKNRDGQMELSRAPIPSMPDNLKAVIEEMK